MYAMTYTSCTRCRRLIAAHPMQNAYGAESQYSQIDGQVVCWECTGKVVDEKKLVPFKPQSTENG
jgi:hypothetical protein